jgi:CBS domain-containing protein
MVTFDMTLAEIMTPRLVTTRRDVPCRVALQNMAAERISALLVVEADKPVGILTERGVVAKALAGFDFEKGLVEQAMSAPLISVKSQASVADGCALLLSQEIRHLAVVDETGLAVGVVTISDIVDALGFEFFINNANVAQMMSTDVPRVIRAHTLRDAAEAMVEKKQSCALVVENDIAHGIVTERDLARFVVEGGDLDVVKVRDAMRSPVETVPYNAPADRTLMYMKQKKIRRIVVVDTDRSVIGVLTQWNIINSLSLLAS